MKPEVKEEIKKLYNHYNLSKNIDNIDNTWLEIFVKYHVVSEDFIREFEHYVNWINVFTYQKLSEDFINNYQHKVRFELILKNQNLSNDFLRKIFNDVKKYNFTWREYENIIKYQKLSENFIKEYNQVLNWSCISAYQELSESFISEFRHKVVWGWIFSRQNISEDFARKYINMGYGCNITGFDENNITNSKIILLREYQNIHHIKSRSQKISEMQEYAEEFNLRFDGEYLYAFRDHDRWGRGFYNRTIFYEKGKYYKDWHCDMRPEVDMSFGLGIGPIGNTPVKVSVDDWGLYVKISGDGTCRVWGFTVIGDQKDI